MAIIMRRNYRGKTKNKKEQEEVQCKGHRVYAVEQQWTDRKVIL